MCVVQVGRQVSGEREREKGGGGGRDWAVEVGIGIWNWQEVVGRGSRALAYLCLPFSFHSLTYITQIDSLTSPPAIHSHKLEFPVCVVSLVSISARGSEFDRIKSRGK